MSKFLENIKKNHGEKIAHARECITHWEQVERRIAYENANPYERMAMDKALF